MDLRWIIEKAMIDACVLQMKRDLQQIEAKEVRDSIEQIVNEVMETIKKGGLK